MAFLDDRAHQARAAQKTCGATCSRYSCAFVGVSFVLCLWATRAKPDAAFYLMPFRAWQFGVGGILAILLADRGPARAVIGGTLSFAGLAGDHRGQRGAARAGLPGLGRAVADTWRRCRNRGRSAHATTTPRPRYCRGSRCDSSASSRIRGICGIGRYSQSRVPHRSISTIYAEMLGSESSLSCSPS
jgi:hypothetical protein